MPSPAPPIVDVAPDWSVLPETVPCLTCGYNLRMLTASRCPECGVTVWWPEILAAIQRRGESRLFEHQWRRRPIRSFFGTLWSLARPWSFWRQPSLRSAPCWGALVFQTIATHLMLAAVTAMSSASHTFWLYMADPQLRLRYRGVLDLCRFRVLPRYYASLYLDIRAACHVMGFLAAFGLLLLACRGTCRRYQFSWRAIVRCICYCGMTAAIWATAVSAPLYLAAAFDVRCVISILKYGVKHGLPEIDFVVWVPSFVIATVMALRDSVGLRRAIEIPITLFALGYAVIYAGLIRAAVAYDSWWNPVSEAFFGWHGMAAGLP